MEHTEDESTLLVTSADGSLSVYDLRNQSTAVRKSDNQEDELLSIKLMKNGKKVVCGTGEGVLSVFSYGIWGDVSDRFPGHPASIDALVKVDEDTLLTGSSDGFIRVVSIHPDKFLGVIGDNHESFPIEKLQFNADRTILGSVTHDNFIRLWDARVLREDYDDGDVKMALAAGSATSPVKSSATNSDDEWEDMDEDFSDSDDSDEEKPQSENDKRAGRLKSESEKFFEDL
jgi:WD40 repeat protein